VQVLPLRLHKLEMMAKPSVMLQAALLAFIPAMAPLARVQTKDTLMKRRALFKMRSDRTLHTNTMSSDNRTTTIYLNDPEVAPGESFGKFISPWHHIPLRPERYSHRTIVNVVVEMPQGTRAKYEMNAKRPCNPLVQSVIDGEYCHLSFGELPYNYGFVPQTWEDPNHKTLYNSTYHSGDNDPLDALVLSGTRLRPGEVVAARVLGSFPMLDTNEMDHKLLVVNMADPKFGRITSSKALKDKHSKVIRELVDWLIDCADPDKNAIIGCDINRRSKCMPADQDASVSVIEETHQFWAALQRGSAPHSEDYGFSFATRCDIGSNAAMRALPIFWFLVFISNVSLWL